MYYNIYKDKEKAEKRFIELIKTNHYKKDRMIRKARYSKDVGAYRIEEHEVVDKLWQKNKKNHWKNLKDKVITSKYDFWRSSYKTISKCAKCGKIVE